MRRTGQVARLEGTAAHSPAPQPSVLRVVKKVRTDDWRWKLAAFEDYPGDYHGALATARRWVSPDEIERGLTQVTVTVMETSGRPTKSPIERG